MSLLPAWQPWRSSPDSYRRPHRPRRRGETETGNRTTYQAGTRTACPGHQSRQQARQELEHLQGPSCHRRCGAVPRLISPTLDRESIYFMKYSKKARISLTALTAGGLLVGLLQSSASGLERQSADAPGASSHPARDSGIKPPPESPNRPKRSVRTGRRLPTGPSPRLRTATASICWSPTARLRTPGRPQPSSANRVCPVTPGSATRASSITTTRPSSTPHARSPTTPT